MPAATAARIQTVNIELVKGFPGGTWVAVSHDQSRVVGSGNTIDEALKAANESGEKEPFMIRVPIESSALIL